MIGTMPEKEEAKRVRMIFDTQERLRRAIRIRAAKTGSTITEVIKSILETNLEAELEEADESMKPPRKPRQ